MKDKELTGYPSIDKPWLQYHSEEAIRAELPKCTMYEYLYNCNKEHLNDIALNYFGRRYSYHEFFYQIELVSKAFHVLGVQKNDVVCICMPNAPEGIYAIYAANRIGAISCTIDPRTNSSGIASFINEVKSKVLVVIDLCYPKIKDIISQTSLLHVIVVPVFHSMPLFTRLAYNIKAIRSRTIIKYSKSVMSWKSFIRSAERQVAEWEYAYIPNTPAVILHTGGTTGEPKAIVFTNEKVNALCMQIVHSGLSSKRRMTYLNVIPLFASFGLICGVHYILSLGIENILIPKFTPEDFVPLLIKYRPNHVMGVPSFFEDIIRDKRTQDIDFSFLKTITIGGDKINVETEKDLLSFLTARGFTGILNIGYGMTEACSVVTNTVSTNTNQLQPGSVGVPLSQMSIKIVEPGTQIEQKYNTIGEICVAGPTIMSGYYGNIGTTTVALQQHEDGIWWLHTGDLGYLNNDGFLFISGRIKRVIFGRNGHTIYPSLSENALSTHPAVSSVAVVGVVDRSRANGTVPTAFIVLNSENTEDIEELEHDLDKYCKSRLPECDCPYVYRFVDALPLTPIGKVDYRALEQMETGTTA